MKCLRAGRCGELTERRRWLMKRAERVAAVKILSGSRKAAQKFWAPQQGHRPLRRATRGAGRAVSPSHGFAVPAPFRQGGLGTGDADCHSQCAHWLRNDRVFARGAVRNRRAGRGVRPCESAARSSVNRPPGTPTPTGGLQVVRRSGRPQGSPLRDVTWGAVERDFCLYIYNGERGRFWTVQGEIFYFCRV